MGLIFNRSGHDGEDVLCLFLQSSPCRISEGELVELNGLMEYMSAQIMNTILILLVCT